MSKTLEQILGAENLVGVIQGIKNGIPADILPPQFLRVTRTVEGNRATYHRVEGTRKTARQVHYGAPSTERQKKDVEEVPVNLLHSIEHENHDPTVLLNLKQIGNEQRQKLGRDEIARQVGLFNTLFENLRLASVYSIFRDGHIYFDGDGNLLNSSAGAALDVFEHEPPKANEPLFTLDNVIVTPHVAFFSETAIIKARSLACREIIAVLKGGQPINWVNRKEMMSVD